MIDQCKHCIVRGDFAACEKTECSYHGLWFVQQLRAELAALKEAARKVVDDAESGAAHIFADALDALAELAREG